VILCLALAEFSYNNSYQSRIEMAPFEALYGRQCRTPLNWSQTGECEIFGSDLVTEAEEKVKIIRNNLKAVQSRKRAMQTKGGNQYSLKWVTLYTCEYLLLEVFNDLVSKANSLLATLVLLKSLKFVDP
jgi:hypothetical protein